MAETADAEVHSVHLRTPSFRVMCAVDPSLVNLAGGAVLLDAAPEVCLACDVGTVILNAC